MTEEIFKKELEKIGIKITDEQIEQLNEYQKLLKEWNEFMNLTGITEKEEVYLKHYYDSLTINKVIDLKEINNLCDVGTGAGFPGLVLKIVFPNIHVVLVDALNKRINFLNEVIKKLGLTGIETVHARSEDYALYNREKFELVTARAVAPLPILMEICSPLVKENYYFIPLKANIFQEMEESKNAEKLLSLEKKDIIKFKLPIEDSNRCIIKYIKTKKTNVKYPRRFSEIKKKPL